MIDRTAEWVAAAVGGRLVAGQPEAAGPRRAVIDSREAAEGDLFVGLAGTRTDGGAFAPAALDGGAWGVLVEPARADELGAPGGGRAVIAAPDGLQALQSLALEWRRELRCPVVGVAVDAWRPLRSSLGE